MEKQKLQPGPKPRIKRALPPPGDFIALGKSSSSKSRPNNESDIKPSQPTARKPVIGAPSHVIPGQKRKDSSPVNPVSAKQTRTFSPSFSRSKEKTLDVAQTLPSVRFVDAPPTELEEMVLAAVTKGDIELIEGLICGAIKALKINKLKPDPMLYLTLMTLAKSQPQLFSTKRVTEHLLQFLRRENPLTAVKQKPNTLLGIMTCNILLHAYQNEDVWPQSFMKVYVEDALGDRSWVDNEHNKDFVSNITKVFDTVLPHKNTGNNLNAIKTQQLTEVPTTALTIDSSSMQIKGEEEKIMEEAGISLETEETPLIKNRYFMHKDEVAVQTYIHETVKEQLNKRQMIDSVSRNTLRFLTAVCGYVEVRLLASQKIETWLQNPKLTRPTQELLISVVLNCNTHSPDDIEVIGNLVKMRLKAKPIANHYVNCMRELLNQHPDNLGTTLKRVIYNELNQQRNPNNMAVLQAMFTSNPENSAKYLASVFQDLLCNRDDFLRAIRALFREIVRSLKHEINLVEFCRGLMQERWDPADIEQPFKDRMFASVIDLINLGCFLCVSPAVKELANALSKGEKRDYSVLQSFQMKISNIQRDAIWFFHTKVKSQYNCNEKDFITGLNYILFLESPETYSQKDNWPPEAERNNLLQLVTEVPLTEDALLRLHLLGLSDETPMNYANTLDVVEKMVLRSAVLASGLNGLEIEREDVIKMLLSLSVYSHPKEIALPAGYIPPKLTIKNLYWKSWLILLVLAATNPSTIGIRIWENYPTARCMMEMLITGCYIFPPFAVGRMPPEDVKAHELQVSRAEKDEILVFEGHLAAATTGKMITESTSLLISQLISLDPSGPARQPPDYVMDQLKTLNEKYKLGKHLCQCRDPDFLLSIIQNQGSSKSMPWLADLVQSSEGSLNALPLQCLCEFLLMKHNTDGHQSKLRSIKMKVAGRLQDLLMGAEATQQSCIDLVQYFINRWSSPRLKDREAAVYGFKTIVQHRKKSKSKSSVSSEDDTLTMSVDQEENFKYNVKSTGKKRVDRDIKKFMETEMDHPDSYEWLHERFVEFPFVDDVMPLLLTALRQALYVEMNACRIRTYILFLGKYHHSQDATFSNLLIHALTHLLTKRKTVINAVLDVGASEDVTSCYTLLLRFFASFFKLKFRDENRHELDENNPMKITWTQGSVHGEQSMMADTQLVQASIVLLTFWKLLLNKPNKDFNFICSMWLPVGSYVCTDEDGNQKYPLIDQNTRLLMVQSDHEELMNEALKELSANDAIALLKSSGISMKAMEILLKHLDHYSVSHPKFIVNCIQDKEYILKTVYLARTQGITSGNVFSNLLCSHGDIKMPENLNVNLTTPQFLIGFDEKKISVQHPRQHQMVFEAADISDVLKETFQSDNTARFALLKRQLSKENILSRQTAEVQLAQAVLQCLISFCKQKSFLNRFCQSKESCTLVRLLAFSPNVKTSDSFRTLLTLLRSHDKKMEELTTTVRHLCHLNGLDENVDTTKKTLDTLIDQLFKASEATITLSIKELFKILKTSSYGNLSKDSLIKVGLHIQEQCPSMFEPFVKILCVNATNQRADKFCIEVLTGLIKETSQCASGSIVDWLGLMDPEILQLNPILLRELLFTKHVSTSATNEQTKSATAYLTSLVAHETRNLTLQDCADWMLGSTRLLKSFNTTSCLDFLTTMINNPRLWQGRENAQKDDLLFTKDATQENKSVLELTLQQVYQMIQLVLAELSSAMSEGDCEGERLDVLMEKRLQLILNISNNTIHLQKAINMTRNMKKFPDDVMQCFLQYLYMKRPTLCNLSEEITNTKSFQALPVNNKMNMDLLIHRLIMCISEPDGSDAWNKKFQSISAIHRRLAIKHPFAFMRQLPLLLSLMKGKNRLSLSNFKWTNQLDFCRHVFNLFDMLRPHVFSNDENTNEIMAVFIDVFLELIHAPCMNDDDVGMFIKKLAELLTHFIASGNKQAGVLLKKHESTFRDLLYDFPNFRDLTTIVTHLATFDEKANSQSSLVPAYQSPWNDAKLNSFRKRLSNNHHDQDLLAVLHEIDESSKRRVSILEHFLEELEKLVTCSNHTIRDRTHELLLRYYKNNPRNASRLNTLYINCLKHENPDVIDSAAKYSSQGILLCDEQSDVLLMDLYTKAITSHAHLDEDIKTTIKSLNIDYSA